MPQSADPRNSGRTVVRAHVRAGDAQLEARRLRVVGQHAERTAVVVQTPGGRGRGPVAGAEAPVGVGVGRGQGEELGQQREHAGDGRGADLGEDARFVAQCSRPVDGGPERQAGVAAQPGELRSQLGHEGGLTARTGEVGLGVELGQEGRVGRAHRLLGSGGDLETARSQLGAEVVDRHGARGQGVDQSGQELLFAGHGQGGPAAVVRQGGLRRARTRLEDQALELPAQTAPQSRGGGPLDQVLHAGTGRKLAQRRGEVGQEERRVVSERVRASRLEVDDGPAAARAARAPHRVVGAPPLDGVDEAPAFVAARVPPPPRSSVSPAASRRRRPDRGGPWTRRRAAPTG